MPTWFWMLFFSAVGGFCAFLVDFSAAVLSHEKEQ
jgi:hypothetical protein